MRFMVMHKVDESKAVEPSAMERIIPAMGRLVGQSIKAGVFKDGAGLHGTATRARVTFAAGSPTVTRGPYEGSHELLAGFAMISTTGIDQAIELAIELGTAGGGRGIEVGPVVEGWDLNGGTRPASAPHRFLLLIKADAGYEESGTLPGLQTVLARWKSEGVLTADATLMPSKRGVRTNVAGGKRRWIDGPFAESKELVAGYSILEVPSFAEAKQFTEEYVAILGDVEVDIREVA